MTPEQLQAQIEKLEEEKESYEDEIGTMEIELQDLKFSLTDIEIDLQNKYRQLAQIVNNFSEGQIIALTDKNTVSLFN